MTVTVLNEGDYNEIFSVFVYANRTKPTNYTIFAVSDSLDPGANKTHEVSWDTTGVTWGMYNISAYVPPVPSEVDTDDNLFIDDTVTVTAPPAHDIAITNVVPSPTTVTVGDSVTISVTVENEGEIDETFNVTVYYDDTSIETETDIVLESGTSTTLTFTWDTTDVAKGTYTIKAEAVVAVDDDTDDNLFTDGTVKIRGAAAPNILIYAVVGAIAAIAIAAAAIYILKFRK